ncbi:hypothetical protein POTOM_046163 [Populus tomentosa]|uniref:EF-hand domain-containing protein n=1 Tax=Populus tomentosa TaxID=118781 RepID=A0A8X8CCA6_POPTO|nr:hypothetical protein POTOM_046163 [Populus tomentosa]
MAIKTCCFSVDGKRVMNIEDFKRWLRKFDADKDGKISRKELEDAIPGGWFTRWKGKAVIRSADSNGNGFIDESEIDNLVEFAQKYLGVAWVRAELKPPNNYTWSRRKIFKLRSFARDQMEFTVGNVQVEFSSGYVGNLIELRAAELSTRARQVLMGRNISPTCSVEMVMKTKITYFFVASSLKKSGLQFSRNVA